MSIRSGYGGSKSKEFKCDAVVFCSGWESSFLLSKKMIGYSIPCLPLKQYSVIMPSASPINLTTFYIVDKGLLATQTPSASWVIQSFGDISGQNIWFDQRRVRIFKNNMCLSFDKKEALSYEKLGINMLSVTPDDMPMVGPLRLHPNIFLNIGHG